MAIIQSGASSDLWTIDPTSKAGRVTLYDPAGNEIFQRFPAGSYIAPIFIRQTAATAAFTVVWTMRLVSSAKRVYVRNIILGVGFDGTAAATSSRYRLGRFSAATPTGGSTVQIIKKRSTYPTSDVTDARFLDTGLTTTGVAFELAAFYASCPRSLTGSALDYVFGTDDGTAFSSFELGSGEGLFISLDATAVIGDTLTGWVAWDER